MKEEIFTLKKVIEICKNYYSGKVDEDDLNDFGNSLIVKPYLSILEKAMGVVMLTVDLEYSDTKEMSRKIAEMYVNKFFYVLLGMYCNVQIDDNELTTLENYDIVYPLLKDYILQFCKSDYEEFNSMLKDTINVSNIENLISVFNRLDTAELTKANENLEKTFKELKDNENLVSNLSDIAGYNDPIVKKIVETSKKEALREARNKKKG